MTKLPALRLRSLTQVLLLAAGFVVLVIISVTSVYLTEMARDDAGSVTHTVEVSNQISDALLQLRRAESAERGYVIANREEFLNDYKQASAAILPAFAHLREITIDNANQTRSVDEMLPLVKTRLAEFEKVIALAQNGQMPEAAQIVRESSSREITTKISDITVRMQKEEDRLFAQRTTTADRSQTLSAIVTTAGSALVLLLAVGSIFLVRLSQRARDEAEELLRQSNANLETTVDERTADLREANEEIQRFAYIVSHDLRSPLVNIMGFTSELEELKADIFGRLAKSAAIVSATEPSETVTQSPPLSTDDQQLADEYGEALGFIKASIGKMDRLITAILNLTREGRREFQPENIEVRDLIENIAGTVAHQASEANATIRVEPLPNLVGDRLALEQIFSNLIDNALKYLKPGVPGDILIRGRSKLGYIIYDVKDNGRGIDAKDHQRIFELFRRAGTQDRPGQGIGLAHVRALVRRLGGTLSVSSELNAGSTFTVMLPARWKLGSEERSS
jgi:signal transduction histidine kinase